MRTCQGNRGHMAALRYITNAIKQQKWKTSETGDTALRCTGKTTVTERRAKYTHAMSKTMSFIFVPCCLAIPGNQRSPTRGLWNSVVCIAACYCLGGLRFELGWSKIFSLLHTCPDRPCSLPSVLYNGYQGSLPGVAGAWR